MQARIQRGFVFTKLQMGLKDIWQWIPHRFPFFTHCTKASVSDDVGLIEMLSDNIDYFKSKPVNIPKITILLAIPLPIYEGGLMTLAPLTRCSLRFGKNNKS